MRIRASGFLGLAIVGTAVGLFLASPSSRAQGGGPFAGMAGTWTGGGTITTNNGNKERLRCRARYEVNGSGNGLKQDLRCASDSYRFDLSTTVNHSGGRITGNWSETSRNVNGNISGSVSGGQINARAESASLSALLSVTTRGDRQTVNIRSPGSEISDVSVSLRRG